MNWTERATTRMVTFSVYPATVQKIRGTSGHFGSIGRSIQVAVEILYERAQRGEVFEEPDWEVIDDLRGLPSNSPTRVRDNLKVPLAFSILPRTERLIEFLAGPKFYKDRNVLIMHCGTLLPELYSDFIGRVLTATERHERWLEGHGELVAKAEAILGVDTEPEAKSTPTRKRRK